MKKFVYDLAIILIFLICGNVRYLFKRQLSMDCSFSCSVITAHIELPTARIPMLSVPRASAAGRARAVGGAVAAARCV